MKKEYRVVAIPGDGIGPEITKVGIEVINKAVEKYDTKINWVEMDAGGCAIDKFGEPLPAKTLEECKKSDAVFLGAVGGWKWDTLPGNKRPEKALLGLRQGLDLFCNLRPAKVFEELKDASPLKNSIVDKGIDILVVRELTGGIYFGEKGRKGEGEDLVGYDVMQYSKKEVKRIAKVAFEAAMKRNKKLTSVEKANVLEVSRVWREAILEIAPEYPEVELNHMYVDNAAMQLVRAPEQFDVIVTGNMFGDILSDEASIITGSIGMLASASLRDDNFGMYEPIHGSAPDIANQNKANPIAQVLSGAMMLRYSFGMNEAADDIENAVNKVLKEGFRTGDIYSEGKVSLGTKEMGEAILKYL
ncbi:3-isopropylmalate dehydrogenase [Hypnocyclicus thermotrophus]|uniref:3-isopropylmalate dehydrogenase n=1 Tax=Hypnocyclicus thermotrophus TaxID=1627895 RepID=A0AA46I5E9_9FUSO|nr:3-isopropylmalate dehydrogenase [Hypnocyclicus thermotrophus]TDT68039.1 3-isopropylmalate dehydrogenase [Hypnocyclicus thermotrophus]